MNSTPPHARAFDLPGWPTPPRVRDIPTTPGSWGWVHIADFRPDTDGSGAVFVDEAGYLWADGNAIPKFRRFTETDANPGAYLYWDEAGLGLYVHPKSLGLLGSISRLDMEADRWLPIATTAKTLPEFGA